MAEVHTPGPGDEHPGAAGALSRRAAEQGEASGLEATSPRPLDLEAAKERCRQASAGPWRPSPNAGDAVIAPKADRLLGIDTEYYGGPVVGESMHPADREFVIHARTDLPAALAEVGRGRAVVESAATASVAVERLVNLLAKDRPSWTPEAVAAWDATQELQQALSLYRKFYEEVPTDG